MKNISFTCKITRKAIIDPNLTPGRVVQIGEIELYEKTDHEIKLRVNLDNNIPQELYEAVTKNPGCIRISESLSTPQDVFLF